MKTTTMKLKALRLGAKKPTKTRQSPSTTGIATAELTKTVNGPLALPTPALTRAAVAPMTFTAITGQSPNRLTKIIGLHPNGTLRKETAANLIKGVAKRVTVNGLEQLRVFLNSLTSADAIAWGVTGLATVNLCTRSDLTATALGALSRTRENFTFPHGPGIMMLDHDGLPNGALLPEQFHQRIIAAAPILANAPMLWRPSASAGCQHPNGQTLTPLTRHRLYIPVRDASLIPEAGQALIDLLWANPGDGWVQIGAAGQPLMRCLVDASVWQPERLDFAGPPVLEDGVTRPNAAGVIYGQEDALFDLRQLIGGVTPAIRNAAEAARKAERAAVRPQCVAQSKKWAAERAPVLAAKQGTNLQLAISTLERASLHNVLMGNFELTTSEGTVRTVAQLLDNPQRFNGVRFADPLDPDDDHRVAVANLLNGQHPHIYSHRHGGVRYELRRQSARVQIGKGLRIDAIDAVLKVLGERRELFDFGDKAIAYVANKKAAPVTCDWLLDHIGRVVDFFSVKAKRDSDDQPTPITEIAEDAPMPVATAIMAKHGSRGFRRLVAVCTAPILRPDGTVLDTPGYDEATGLLYVTDDVDPPSVPLAPTKAQALDALVILWSPFREFPVDDAVSAGVLLSALLSAALRPSLPTCPAYGIDAPAVGTGKTLLAKGIGAMSTGGDVAVMPPAKDEEEWRKRLFAGLRGGDTVLLLDNVREPLGNAAIDSFITSPSFKDRILGESTTCELPNKALFLITGNNLVLTGDTHRRVLLIRLDAKQERPFTREFAFNPQSEVIKNRRQMVVAALTIVRAYISAGSPKAAPGRIASFELWDDLVRQPLCWLMRLANESGRMGLPAFDDPAKSIIRAESENPEQAKLGALLHTWHAAFGNEPTTVAAVQSHLELHSPESIQLNNAIDEIAGQRGAINPRILGRWIERHAEQRHSGMRFVRASKVHGVVQWQVLRNLERIEQGG